MVFKGFDFGGGRYLGEEGNGGGGSSSRGDPEKGNKKYLKAVIVAGFLGFAGILTGIGWYNSAKKADNLEAENKTLAVNYDNLELEHAMLQGDYSTLDSNYKSLDSSLNAMADSVDHLNARTRGANASVSGLQKSLEESRARYSLIEQEYSTKRSDDSTTVAQISTQLSSAQCSLDSIMREFKFLSDSVEGRFTLVQNGLYTSIATSSDGKGMQHNVEDGYKEGFWNFFNRDWRPVFSFTKNGEFTGEGRERFKQLLDSLYLRQSADSVAREIVYGDAQPIAILNFTEETSSKVSDVNIVTSPFKTYSGYKKDWIFHKPHNPADSTKNVCRRFRY
jgi:hypothetical protein